MPSPSGAAADPVLQAPVDQRGPRSPLGRRSLPLDIGRHAEVLTLLAALLVLAWAWETLRLTRPFGLHGDRALVLAAGALALGVVVPRMLQRLQGVGRPDASTMLIASAALVVTAVGTIAVLDDGHAGRAKAAMLGVAVVGGAVGAWLARRSGEVPAIRLVLLAVVVASWVVADIAVWMPKVHFYDFLVYRAGGVHFASGQAVYLPAPITAMPTSAANDWFLYPPPLVPVLWAIAKVPVQIASVAFAVLMALCGLFAYRALGITWRWALLLLAFPPMQKGLESGNVANLTFLLFALGARVGWPLVLGVLFKVQNVIPAAWLVRERRWRQLGVGITVVAVVCLATLPITGIGMWRDWLVSLAYRTQSQINVPLLFGVSLARDIPPAVFVVIAAVACVAAFAIPGRRGLASLGLASIVASPSLWLHGFVMAIPAVLALPSDTAIWTALGIGGLGAGRGGLATAALWAMALAGLVGVLIGRWSEARDAGPLDPVGPGTGPWSADVPGERAGLA